MSNTNTAANHKETTAHFCKRMKHHGIKASVSKYTSCGVNWIRVSVPSPDAEFSEDQQRQIRLTAKNIGLTFSRGLEINIEQMTNPKEFHFVLP